ncbi:MAG: NAD-dependent deacylase [Desulfobulbaceae bacterium]|nr:NAD-dependent deacylase [Desulfobulbaceae bacterium]
MTFKRREAAIADAAQALKVSRKTVALTGAGVSTESGIPDFRSANGLWSRFDPIEYGTLGAFRRNPQKVWEMLGELLELVNALPNDGHIALADLEEMGLLNAVITQNIDGLHQQAGSRNVVEFHGSLARFVCLQCRSGVSLEEVLEGELPPSCRHCRQILKPDIVFFDEQISLDVFRKTEKILDDVDLLLVIGTSCQVVPAALIPQTVKRAGGRIIEINLEPALGGLADISIVGSFSEIMRLLIAKVSDID